LPTISVVTPSFNQARFVRDTIESVLSQDYPNLEYVVIDGGSTDGSADIIREYASHLSYWTSEPDRGHGHALNKGFARTTGEIMAWVNSDDKYLPWTFEVVAEIFSAFPDVNWITGTQAWWDEKGRLTAAQPVYKNIYDFLLGNFGWIQQESVFWRRSLWERAGGKISEDYRLMVDGELWCRFFQADRLYTADAVIGGYRMYGENRASTHRDACIVEMNQAIAELKSRCTPAILKNSEALQRLLTIRRNPEMRKALAPDIAQEINRACEEAAYDRLTYTGGRWQLSKVRFSACQ
jgi:glycosyltransferase involved in cell wall biosynthesis